jgi:hypothetical protein
MFLGLIRPSTRDFEVNVMTVRLNGGECTSMLQGFHYYNLGLSVPSDNLKLQTVIASV